ncbi:MAG: hypothetical protein PHH83_01675 [Patescibacteria group bacterium]|nr:hypothetical protein [Patescibacteria group bacterium]
MIEKILFKCDLNCPECEKECESRIEPNQKEQSKKFDEIIQELNIFNNNVIGSILNSIDALKEDTDLQKIEFIKKCSKDYIKDLIENIGDKTNRDFIITNFKKFLDHIANQILEKSK